MKATIRNRARITGIGSTAKRKSVAWPRYLWAWLFLLVILVVAAIVHVRAKLTAVELGYALSDAASEHQQLLTDQHKLQVEVATLRSPQRLRKLAIEKFGLVEPNSMQLLSLGQTDKSHAALSRMTSR